MLKTILFSLAISLIISSCSKSGSSNPTPTPTAPKPTVTATNVKEGAYGTTVLIAGANFSASIASDIVYFDGVQAVVTAATATQLTTTVPLAAGTGAIVVAVNGVTANGPVFTYDLSPVVSTFAGSGANFYNDGTLTAASFSDLDNLGIDASDNLYTADFQDYIIRKITPTGVTTIAGSAGVHGFADGVGSAATFFGPSDIAFDASGNGYITNFGGNTIRKITPDSIVTTFAGSSAQGLLNGIGIQASFTSPARVVTDNAGNLYVTDEGNRVIRRITPAGVVSTFAGSGAQGLTNGPASSATFEAPYGLGIDKSGNLYVSEYGSIIRKVAPDGTVSALAGSANRGFSNGTGAAATFNGAVGLRPGPDGNVYVADRQNNLIRKITPAGVVTTFAGTGKAGLSNGSALLATFDGPSDIVFDSKGAMYVADTGNNVIRKIVLE